MLQNPEGQDRARLSPRSWSQSRFFNLSMVLARHKRTIFLFVFIAAIGSAIVSLLLPSIYEANTKILVPQQTPSIANVFGTSALAGLAGGAKDLTASLKNPADVYVSMLESRTVADDIIDRFHLMSVYHSRRRMDCRKTLSGNVIITSDKGGVISITVDDKDPNRAAGIANGFVEELAQTTKKFGVTEAGQRRAFFEDQLQGEREALVVAEGEFLHTQQTSKLIAPESQTKATMEGLGKLREVISEKEVMLRTSQTFATDRNPNVVRLQAEIANLREQLAQYERNGGPNNVVIPTDKLPEAGLDYLRKARAVKYHEAVMEILLRQYEAAKLDESREATTMQILDVALPPEFKVRPVRKLIVAITCFVALILAIAWSLFREALTMVKANPRLSQQYDLLVESWLGRGRFGLRKPGVVSSTTP